MLTQRLSALLTALIVCAPAWLVVLTSHPAQAQRTVQTEDLSPDQVKKLREARNLHNRSRTHYDRGSWDEALEAIRQARALIEEVQGADSPLVTQFINDMAYYHMGKGDLAPVEGLFKEVIRRTDKAHGPRSVEAALARENLGAYYADRGLTRRAEALFKQAMGILKGHKAPNTADHVARLLGRAAEAQVEAGDLKAAERTYKQALKLAEKTHGVGHVNTGKFINDLALLYSRHMRRYNEAERLLKRLLTIIEPKFGPSAQVWAAKQNLGMLYLRSGKYAQSEPLLKELYTHQRSDHFLEVQGSPKLAFSASNLGELYWAMGRMDEAVTLWREANDRYARFEGAALSIGSEQERLRHAARLVNQINATLSMHLKDAPDDPKAAENALLRVLRTKGRVAEAQADTYRALREGMTPRLKEQLHSLAQLRSAQAFYALSGQDPDRAQKLARQLEELERELATRSARLGEAQREVTLDGVRAGLPSGGALVELVRYQPFDVKRRVHAPARYAAYLLKGSGAVVGVDLGAADAIDARVKKLRGLIANRAALDAEVRALHQTLVAPWASHAAGARHLIIAPDGGLNLLPFELLQGADGTPLLKHHPITYLTTGRRLGHLQATRPSRAASVVVANPDYGSPRRGRSRKGIAGAVWEPLPGTAREAEAIAPLLGEAKVIVKREATETALKKIHRPRVLHLATHGFFLDGEEGGAAGARGFVIQGDDAEQELEAAWSDAANPLLRSGLVLAGANAASGVADGYLTALEAASLDLDGTQLVVMSACETGLGEITAGQGVFGLRRAVAFAGAEAQVMSLWQVSDEATTELMRAFYTHLKAGKSRGDALRAARLELAGSPRWSHPHFWSAFVLSGNWQELR